MTCNHKPITKILVSRDLSRAISDDTLLKVKELRIEIFGAYNQSAFVDLDYLKKFGYMDKKTLYVESETSKEFEFYSDLIPICQSCLTEYLQKLNEVNPED